MGVFSDWRERIGESIYVNIIYPWANSLTSPDISEGDLDQILNEKPALPYQDKIDKLTKMAADYNLNICSSNNDRHNLYPRHFMIFSDKSYVGTIHADGKVRITDELQTSARLVQKDKELIEIIHNCSDVLYSGCDTQSN
ncbi:hypothetical protein HQ533_05845 [Candidatus Woesearchaeota archaeon]|nr:hypothetical protein [Candidatus Woesearchaeota archaeon]